MSIGVNALNFVPTIDPKIDVERLEKLMYGIETTAVENTYQTFPIQNYSANSITVVANPPNNQVFVSSKFDQMIKFLITFTGTSGGPGIHLLQAAGLPSAPGVSSGNAYYDAPRCFPLANALSNLQVSMNTDQNSINLNQFVRILTRYYNNIQHCQDRMASYTPTMPDQYLQYEDGIGYARSELRGYGDNVLQCPRGGFVNCLITRNDSTGNAGDIATVELTVQEALWLSPLASPCQKEKPAFAQLNTITITETLNGRGNGIFGGLIASLWSHANPDVSPTVFSNATVEILETNVSFQYLTPPLDMQIPRTIVYDYVQPQYYATVTNSPVSPGSQLSIPFQNIQLDGIPEKMYLWVSQRDQDNDMFSTDTAFSIENVSITFNNKPGILAPASKEDLYDIAVKNGCNLSYRQFRKDVGAVLCLKFGEDIPLANLISSGVGGSFNFSGNVLCTNNYNTSIIPSLNTLFINPGTFTISNGKCLREINLLTRNNVLATRNSGVAPIHSPEGLDALGGFAWSDIVNFFKKAGRTAIDVGKKVVPILAPEYAPVVGAVDQAARSLGFGKMRGGRRLTKREMMAMM